MVLMNQVAETEKKIFRWPFDLKIGTSIELTRS